VSELDNSPVNLTVNGQYCWDVTVEETDQTYDDASDGLNAGSEDPNNECFTIQIVYEGHSPGFYKNNADKWGAKSWVEESPTDKFNTVFSTNVVLNGNGKLKYNDPTLRQALDANGGGINALARACVTAKLNAEHPAIDYPIDDASVIIQECHNAIISGDKNTINALATQLDTWNNLGSDVSQQWSP